MRELSATEIAEVTTLYEFCCRDIRAERIDAGRRLGEWLMVKRDQDVDLKSLTYILDIDIDAIYGWITSSLPYQRYDFGHLSPLEMRCAADFLVCPRRFETRPSGV